jgi:hypothetical protein
MRLIGELRASTQKLNAPKGWIETLEPQHKASIHPKGRPEIMRTSTHEKDNEKPWKFQCKTSMHQEWWPKVELQWKA